MAIHKPSKIPKIGEVFLGEEVGGTKMRNIFKMTQSGLEQIPEGRFYDPTTKKLYKSGQYTPYIEAGTYDQPLSYYNTADLSAYLESADWAKQKGVPYQGRQRYTEQQLKGQAPIMGEVKGQQGSRETYYGQTPYITADRMTGDKPVDFSNMSYDEQLSALTSKFSSALNSAQGLLSPTTGETGAGEDDYLKKYLEGMEKPKDMTKTYEGIEAQEGLGEKKQAVADLSAQLNTITAEAQEAQLTLEQQAGGRNITSTFLGRQQQEIVRMAAIKSLPVQAQLAAAQGNLALAQDKVNTLFELKSEYEDKLYNYNKEVRQAVYDYATKREQRILDAQQREDDRAFTLLRDNLNYGQSLAKTAISNGQADLAAQIMALDPNSPNYPNALANLARGIRGAEPTTTNIDTRQYIQDPTNPYASIPNPNYGQAITSGQVSPITQSIISNPSLFDDLTPTLKGNVISELQGAGYDTANLGVKALSDTAIKEINQTNFALTSLEDLRVQIQNNLEFIGPLKGWAKLNPWSKARQIQSTIDRVRQTVGKALEGGVLRKEDEEKYKKILATITDTPETATFKIDNLITAIQGNITDYKGLQQAAGRSLNVRTPLQQKRTVSSGQTSTGNSYTITEE